MVNQDVQYLISLATAFLCIGGLIYAYNQEKKKKPSLTAGKMFNIMFIRNRVDILVTLIIGISVAEAIWASFVSLATGSVMPAIVRIVGHGSIQAASILCALNLNAVFLSWWEDRKNGAKFFRFLLYALGVGLLPFLNAVIIAIGVGPTAYFHFFGLFRDTSNPFSFSHFPKMGFEMAVTTVMLFVHWFFLALDMVEVGADGGAHLKDAEENESDINKKINKKGQKEKDNQLLNDVKSRDIAHILNFVLDSSKHDINNYVLKATQRIDSLSTNHDVQMKLARLVKELRSDVDKAINSGSKQKKEEAANKVRATWTKSPNNGQGFGGALPK